MTFRPNPGDRIRLERAMSEAQLEALADLCRDLGVPRDRWTRVDAIYRTFAAAAGWRLVRELEAEGRSRDAALLVVEGRLGIPRSTLDSWSRRWVEAAWRAAA